MTQATHQISSLSWTSKEKKSESEFNDNIIGLAGLVDKQMLFSAPPEKLRGLFQRCTDETWDLDTLSASMMGTNKTEGKVCF